MASTSRVVAVEKLTEVPEGVDMVNLPKDGIVSSQFIEYKDMDDELLEMLYQNDPNLIMEKRPDWVKQRFPNITN